MSTIVSFFYPDSNSLRLEANLRNSSRSSVVSTILSYLQLKKFHSSIEIITDAESKEVIVNDLELPFTNVRVLLESKRKLPHNYLLTWLNFLCFQQTPFFCVRNDIFLWKEIPQAKQVADILAFSPKVNDEACLFAACEIEKSCQYLPDFYVKVKDLSNPFYIYNTCIVGGQKTSILNSFATEALEFLERNHTALADIPIQIVDKAINEYLFSCFLAYNNITPTFLVDYPINYDCSPYELFEVIGKQTGASYVSNKAKKRERTKQYLSFLLSYRFPTYYNAINAHFTQKGSNNRHGYRNERNKNNKLETYEAARQNNLFPLERTFPRTFAAIDIFCSQKTKVFNTDTISSVEDIQSFILDEADTVNHSILNDVFSFENQKLKRLSFANEDRTSQYENYEQFTLLSRATLYDQVLAQQEDIEITISKWMWAIRNQNKDLFRLKVIYNIAVEPSDFQTIFVSAPGTPGITEYQLSTLDAAIVEVFTTPITVRNAITSLSNHFGPKDKEENMNEITEALISRVRELIFLGILNWQN